VTVDASTFEPPTTYEVVVLAAPSAGPSPAPSTPPTPVPSAFVEDTFNASILSEPLVIGAIVVASLFVGACCLNCRKPNAQAARERRMRARNAAKSAWDEDADDQWGKDLPTSPLHGATSDHARRLEPESDAVPGTPAGLFSGWHISNFVRSRSRSPSSARSWRSPNGSARSASSSVRGNLFSPSEFVSWFLGGREGPDGQIDEVEMQAQRTPLADDQAGASIWCEPDDDEVEAAVADSETRMGRQKRPAGAVEDALAAAQEEADVGFVNERDDELAPLSPQGRPSRRNVTGGGGRRAPHPSQ